MFMNINWFTVWFMIKVGKILFTKSKRTLRKSVVFKIILIAMFNPQPLKILIILFLIDSTSRPDKFCKIPKPSSQYKPAFSDCIF